MAQKGSDILPRPHRIHHVVEDFLTTFNANTAHLVPLRRFLESVFDSDMRSFYAETCFKVALTYQNVPKACEDFLNGHGLLGLQEQTQAAKDFSFSMQFSQ